MAIIEPGFLEHSEKISLLNLKNHLQAWGRATVWTPRVLYYWETKSLWHLDTDLQSGISMWKDIMWATLRRATMTMSHLNASILVMRQISPLHKLHPTCSTAWWRDFVERLVKSCRWHDYRRAMRWDDDFSEQICPAWKLSSFLEDSDPLRSPSNFSMQGLEALCKFCSTDPLRRRRGRSSGSRWNSKMQVSQSRVCWTQPRRQCYV